MPDTDPYRPGATDATPGMPSPALTGGNLARGLLWALVVISAVCNLAASFGGGNAWVHLACGAVTVLCGGTLVVRTARARR